MAEYPTAPEGSAAEAFFESMQALGMAYAGATHEGGRFQCPHPGHDDDKPSLDVTIGDKGTVVLNCKPCRNVMEQREWFLDLRDAGVKTAGLPCTVDDIEWGERAPALQGFGREDKAVSTTGTPIVYTYKHADGKDNFRVVRVDVEYDDGSVGKVIRPRRYVRGHGYIAGLKDVERTPLHLDRFERWHAKTDVLYLVEGEKAAEALRLAGNAATTFHGGTDAPRVDDWVTRYGFDRWREVRVWPDADGAGVEFTRRLLKELKAGGARGVPWGVPADRLQPKDDAYDVIERGEFDLAGRLTREDADALAELAPAPARNGAPVGVQVGGKALVPAVPYSGLRKADLSRPYGVAALVDPREFAREYLARHYTDAEGLLTLRYMDLRFWLWCGTHYRPMLPDEVLGRLADDLDGAQETDADGNVRPIKVKRMVKGELLGALQDLTIVSEYVKSGTLVPATGGVPFRNGWLDVSSGSLVPLSPARDIRWVVPRDYDPDAAKPVEWFRFLDSIGWVKGDPRRRLLRQWFGYVLSGDTDMQKAALLIGPPRGGKGTIIRVQEAMMGEGSTGLDLGAFSTNFGLSPIIGKGLATIGDARFDIKTDKAVVRRLLSVIGQDTITIDRKHKDPVSIRAGARLVLATNEVPALIEASSALASRFLFFNFTESFLDREDLGLAERIIAELPGIVKWALGGLEELRERGHFTETDEGREMKREMIEIANPIVSWIESECEFDERAFATTDDLHSEYAVWAEHRRHFVPSQIVFARDLSAAFPASKVRRGQKRIGSKMVRGFVGVRLGTGGSR